MGNNTSLDDRIVLIFKLLILFFSVDYIGNGTFSVYRFIIFPLSVYGAFLMAVKKTNGNNIIFRCLFLFLIWFTITEFSTGENWVGALMLIPLLYFISSYFSSDLRFREINYALLFSFYALPHLLSLIMGIQINPNSWRFTGMHMDANFCSFFLAISATATTQLLMNKKNSRFFRLIFFLYLLITIYMVFLTGSRGGILSVVLAYMIIFYSSKKKSTFKKFIFTILLLFAYQIFMTYVMSLPNWVSVEDSRLDSVLCRFKPNNFEEGGGRSEIWAYVIQKVLEPQYFIFPLGRYEAMKGFVNGYVHNSFLELIVRAGLLVGMIFDAFLLYYYIKTVWRLLLKKIQDNMVFLRVLSIVAITNQFTLSGLDMKCLWFFIFILFSIGNQKVIFK